MRTLATVFLAALIVTLAPTVLADHGNVKSTPAHGDHHSVTAQPHGQTPAHVDPQDGHPYHHTILQRLHNAVFGRYHHNGTCETVHGDDKNLEHGRKGQSGHVGHGAGDHVDQVAATHKR